ncbi:MAG: 4Fe-4S dicluster domain-containing protein [Thermomicrobiales bacterium]
MSAVIETGTTGARQGAVGFLTDISLCIGCKACEVACKQWNELPAEPSALSGASYDNTLDLGATTWRHVAFVEQSKPGTDLLAGLMAGAGAAQPGREMTAWLMMSDVCKHCVRAGCLEACPTGAIIRTEFDTVVIQQDICNGCGYCIPACPFGVPQLSETDHRAHKCTLCYDRLRDGMEPACAKACPTKSIQFGLVSELMPRARERVETLRARGFEKAHIDGDRVTGGDGGIDGLNAFFVLTDSPETFNLPAHPQLPQDKVLPALLTTALAAIGLGVAAFSALRGRP